jgi:hypothetical protein
LLVACDFDKTQTITLDEFIVPGGVGETILRHFGTDLDIEIEIVETEASLIDHRQSHPSNELHVKCLKCQQIRIIKRPPGHSSSLCSPCNLEFPSCQ